MEEILGFDLFLSAIKKNYTLFKFFLLLHIKSTLDILLTISNIAMKVHLNYLLFLLKKSEWPLNLLMQIDKV